MQNRMIVWNIFSAALIFQVIFLRCLKANISFIREDSPIDVTENNNTVTQYGFKDQSSVEKLSPGTKRAKTGYSSELGINSSHSQESKDEENSRKSSCKETNSKISTKKNKTTTKRRKKDGTIANTKSKREVKPLKEIKKTVKKRSIGSYKVITNTKKTPKAIRSSKSRTVGLKRRNTKMAPTSKKPQPTVEKPTVKKRVKATKGYARRKTTNTVLHTTPTITKRRRMAGKTTTTVTSKVETETVNNKMEDKTTLEPNYLVIDEAASEDKHHENETNLHESIIKSAKEKFALRYAESMGKTSYGLKKSVKKEESVRNETQFVPKLMIIETDRVLWPFVVGTDVVPPFGMPRYQPTTKRRKTKDSWWNNIIPHEDIELYDRNSTVLRLFPDVPEVLVKLHKKGIKIAVAMTTPEIATVRHLLHLFDLDHLFAHMEIDTEDIDTHIKGIKAELGVDLVDTVYLGANETNLEEVNKMKILTVCVNHENGLNLMHIYKAIYMYNLRPLITKVKGKIALKSEIVSDELEEETQSESTLKPTPLRKPTRVRKSNVTSASKTSGRPAKSKKKNNISTNNTSTSVKKRRKSSA